GTAFADVDLSQAKGLDIVQHVGPSTIGIDTIFLSKGKIPEVFLRGAGVPDNFITYIGSLVGKSIEFYSCFISYNHSDNLSLCCMSKKLSPVSYKQLSRSGFGMCPAPYLRCMADSNGGSHRAAQGGLAIASQPS